MNGHTHALTGLADRAALDMALKSEIERAEGVALCVMDLDNFAAVCNEYGTEGSDPVLQSLAELLRRLAPGQVFHVSGDEFAVLMPGLSLEQAFLRIEAMRAEIHNGQQLCDPAGKPITISLGVAQYPRDAKNLRGLLSAADAALLAAKEAGRNQVGLPPNEEMIMKSSYYPASSIRRLKTLAERLNRKESQLLREALEDLLHKYDQPRAG